MGLGCWGSLGGGLVVVVGAWEGVAPPRRLTGIGPLDRGTASCFRSATGDGARPTRVP